MADDEPCTLVKFVEGENLGLSKTSAKILEGPVTCGVHAVFGLKLLQSARDEKRSGLDRHQLLARQVAVLVGEAMMRVEHTARGA
jgi:hypothetical protein